MRNFVKGGAEFILFLLVTLLVVGFTAANAPEAGIIFAAMPQLWGFKKLTSESYPVKNVAAVHTPQNLYIDLKRFLPDGVLAQGFVRVRGSIIKAGAGPGTATGRENPEGIIRALNLRHTPSLGVIGKNSLTPRGTIIQGIFDRGYAIREADVTDAAATVSIDFFLPFIFKMPGATNPIEWGFPISLFTTAQLVVECGGRDQLFSGGSNTWDLSGLQVEVWADTDYGVGGGFHVVEEFEQTVTVDATRKDLPLRLDKGFLYSHLLAFTERDNVLVDDVMNNIYVESGGRTWTVQGDDNANGPVAGSSPIQRWNRETHVNNAAESLTGVYFIPALRDGMFKRTIDAGDKELVLKFDVTKTSGVEVITVRGRRMIPLALNVPIAAA